MINGKEYIEEEKYLKLTDETIKNLLGKYIDSSEKQDKEIISHRKFLWDNRNEFDEIEINENCGQVALKEKIHSKQVTRIRTLERQIQSPYFARIDFKEDGEEAESFYIGISTVENEDDFDILVFDWRSPVSTMYYDFEVGRAHYEAPGRTIEGNIEFARQFNIKNGKIVFMHDSNKSLCDESLGEMLGGNATDKMKNIVATIQKEQNDIIRNEDSKVLFIQGAAGSGKTSIALHRAAYLLYKHRKELTADNILIFSPNEVFAEYISNVLPELGESNINQTTFEIYSKTLLPNNYSYESKNQHLDYIYTNLNDDEVFKVKSKGMEFKNSTEFMDILNKFILDIPRLITDFKPIVIDEREIISKKNVEKTFLSRFKDIPFLNRLDVVKESINSQVETKYLLDSDEFEYVEDRKQFQEYCREEVNNQINDMLKTSNQVLIYKILWENIKRYTDNDLRDIKDITLESINSGIVNFEDITPIIYIRLAMEGFRNYRNVKHILIDEAQDYSPIFYEIVKRSFVGADITIMGDLNQRIDKHSNVKDRNSIVSIFKDTKTAILRKSYRSTYDITTFTKEILDTHEPIEAVDRIGEKPKVYTMESGREEKIYNIIENMVKKDFKSIAVICKNKRNSIELYNRLKELIPEINLIDGNESEFKIGINVISSYIAKGLEFDGVIVADGDEYEKNRDENLFYTSCTRALHELHILSKNDISNILPKNKNLYEEV